MSSLKEYGSGVTVYFKTMKLLALVFTLMALTAVPALVINSNGRGRLASLNAITLSSTTLGNLGLAPNSTQLLAVMPGWALVAHAGQPLTPTAAGLIYSISDLIACAIFMVFYVALRVGEVREAAEVDKATTTAEDYTIYLPTLPSATTEELLGQHFSEFVQAHAPHLPNHPPDFHAVDEVHIVERDPGLVDILVTRGRIRRRSERIAEALRSLEELERRTGLGAGTARWGCCACGPSRLVHLRARKEALDARASALTLEAAAYKSTHLHEAAAAFVTFRHQATQKWVLGEYALSTSAGPCLQPKRYRLSGRARIHPRAAPAPSSVIWANLRVSTRTFVCRMAATALVSLVLISVSFVALWVASAQAASANTSRVHSVACGEGGDGEAVPLAPFSPTLAALHATRGPATANATKYCTCASMPWSQYTLDQVEAGYEKSGLLDAEDCPLQACPRRLELSPGSVWRGLCAGWVWDRSAAALLVAGSTFVVLAINNGLGNVLRYLSDTEGHASQDDLNASLVQRLFIATFVNTGVLVVFINVAFPEVVGTEALPTGKYRDFSPAWYSTVGTSLLTTMFFNILTPHAYNCVCALRHCDMLRNPDLSAPTQRDLNRKVLGPLNDPAFRYARLLNTVFVCFVFSTGLPLMLPIAAASFIVFYWAEKYFFLYFYRRPPACSVSLQQSASGVLPLALILHLAVGAWMLSGSAIFTASMGGRDTLGLSRVTDPLAAQIITLAGDHALVVRGVERLSQPGVLPMVVVLLGLVGLWAGRLAVRAWGLVGETACGALVGDCGARARRAPHAWNLHTPCFSDAVRSGEMQGREGYNVLLDEEVAHAFGITLEWARTHRLKDCAQAGGGAAAISAPDPQTTKDDEEDALELEDEGTGGGMARVLAISGRRLGLPAGYLTFHYYGGNQHHDGGGGGDDQGQA